MAAFIHLWDETFYVKSCARNCSDWTERERIRNTIYMLDGLGARKKLRAAKRVKAPFLRKGTFESSPGGGRE